VLAAGGLFLLPQLGELQHAGSRLWGVCPEIKEIHMRNAIAALIAAGAVSFAGAGVANATPTPALPSGPAATVTTVAADDATNDDSDDTGLWGLAGLLGLLGLLGLKRRNDVDRRVGTGTTPGGTAGPRM
jgi:MYXO-CTERM domain-containing protein